MNQRILKFRAWDFENKTMYDHHITEISLSKWLADENFNFILLMQYTGLKDKNGKEIYEGDVCEQVGGLFHVIWWKAGFSLEPVKDKTGFGYAHHFKLGSETMKKTEIIGNIYENKELLK